MLGYVGHESDDYRLMMETDDGRSLELNNPGLYPSTCIELSIEGLAVTAVLQAGHINDYEGASSTSISFDYAPQVKTIHLFCLRYRLSSPSPSLSLSPLSPSPSPLSLPPPLSPSFFKASLEDLMDGTATASLSIYDEAALCSNAFKLVI